MHSGTGHKKEVKCTGSVLDVANEASILNILSWKKRDVQCVCVHQIPIIPQSSRGGVCEIASETNTSCSAEKGQLII